MVLFMVLFWFGLFVDGFVWFWVGSFFILFGLFVKRQNLGFICDVFSNSNPCKYVALFLDSSVVSPCGHIFLSIRGQQFCTQKISVLDV